MSAITAVRKPRPVIGSSRKKTRQARQRVEDPRGAGDRADQPAPAVGQQPEAEGDGEADGHGDHRENDVLEQRVRVAVEVLEDPARADPVLADAASSRCGRGSRPLPAASPIVYSSASTGSEDSRVTASPEVRNSETSSTESTPAIRPASSTHRRVAGLRLEQVGQRVAQYVVELDHRGGGGAGALRNDVAREVALGHPAQRPPVGIHNQRVRHLAAGQLRSRAPRPDRRGARSGPARDPRPARGEGPGASARDRTRRTPRRTRSPAPSGAPEGWRTGPGAPLLAARPPGRPS